MQYRRANISGASYFFTLVTERRQKLFIDDKNVKLLREAFRHVMQKYPFVIEAAVILPEHLHCIWTLPTNDADFFLVAYATIPRFWIFFGTNKSAPASSLNDSKTLHLQL